jgi:hypothetical protein
MSCQRVQYPGETGHVNIRLEALSGWHLTILVVFVTCDFGEFTILSRIRRSSAVFLECEGAAGGGSWVICQVPSSIATNPSRMTAYSRKSGEGDENELYVDVHVDLR